MSRTEFLQELKKELEGRVPYSVIQENIRYYDSYISDETAKGYTEEEVIESLGGPRIIARTIVDAALDTEDRPDGYDIYGSGATEDGQDSYGRSEAGNGPFSGYDNDPFYREERHRHVHFIDFNKWYVRLIAGLIVFFVIYLVITLFLGLIGLAGMILAYIWPVLLILMIIWMFKGRR